jgi:hypothetical protein
MNDTTELGREVTHLLDLVKKKNCFFFGHAIFRVFGG